MHTLMHRSRARSESTHSLPASSPLFTISIHQRPGSVRDATHVCCESYTFQGMHVHHNIVNVQTPQIDGAYIGSI